MTLPHDASSVYSTMFETYRMLGQDHEIELERLARTSRAAKPRTPLRAKRRTRRLPLAVRLAATKLKALAG